MTSSSLLPLCQPLDGDSDLTASILFRQNWFWTKHFWPLLFETMPCHGLAETLASDGQDLEPRWAGVDLGQESWTKVQHHEHLLRRQVPQCEGGTFNGRQKMVSRDPQFCDIPESFLIAGSEKKLVVGGHVVNEERRWSRRSRRAVEDQPVCKGEDKIRNNFVLLWSML